MNDYYSTMISLVQEAGNIALKFIHCSHPELKADTSVITEADRTISSLAHALLAPYLATGEHLLIDEEDPHKGDYLNGDVLDRTPFVWAIDPIDATRAYANRMPHYGISVGLFQERRPWLGAVYFPSLKELFTCDGTSAFFIENAFTAQEIKNPITPVDVEISSRSVFIATDDLLDVYDWDSQDCRIMILSAAVCEFCWPAIGRGCGSLSRVHLWDMAGAWPIFEQAGLKMYSMSTGKPMESLDASLFLGPPTPWKMKDFYILSSPKNFPLLRSRLKIKQQG